MTAPLPIVFIPGASSDATVWDAQKDFFAQNRRAITVDLTDLDDIGAMADRVLASTDGDMIICGTSMGGYVALEVLKKAPNRIKQVIFCCTSARADTPERKRQRSLEIAAGADKWRAARQDDTHYHAFLGRRAQTNAALIARLRDVSNRVGYAGFANHQKACAARPDSRDFLPQVSIPALVISGDEDTLIPPDMQQEMHALLPQSVFVNIAGAGHIAHQEEAEAVTEAIARFINPPA
ncbi:MAG: alpha/beta fold hydrolase [Bdellovibrionales bacterium]|jgi:pimeloyl-ACP methyl ester carboxylesterase|nr:alpha/beta fold hydrolase [Bdellovibrionales bacterium]